MDTLIERLRQFKNSEFMFKLGPRYFTLPEIFIEKVIEKVMQKTLKIDFQHFYNKARKIVFL